MSKSRKRTLRILKAAFSGLYVTEGEMQLMIETAYRRKHRRRVGKLNREEKEARFQDSIKEVECGIIKLQGGHTNGNCYRAN